MIEKYIKELLLTQDKVTVPHLGTFTASFSPSSISADGATLLPPHKEISFSIYIREEDRNDDFMKAVMKAENIGYYDFNESLLAFVEQVQQSIATYGKHHLEGLGTLVKDEYNKIILQQDPNEFLLGDSFGLPTLDTNFIYKLKEQEVPEIQEVKPIETEPSEGKPNATKTKVVEKYEEANRQEIKRQQEILEQKPNKDPKTTLDTKQAERKTDLTWWIAVVPMVFLLAFLIYLFTSPEAMQNFKSYFTSEEKVNEEVNNPINEEITSSLDSEENSNLTQEEINPIDNRLSDNPTPIQDTKAVTEPPPVAKDSKASNDELVAGKFYLVYGSFSAKNGAEKARKMLENQGLEVKLIFLSAKNMYRVVIGEFNSYEEANNKKVALGSDFSQTWVLKGE
ncbi:MAG: hypothetical protein OHK0057_06030 [Thermoflexibacter sp.]